MSFEQFQMRVSRLSAYGWRLRLTEHKDHWLAEWRNDAGFADSLEIDCGDKRSAFYFAVMNFNA